MIRIILNINIIITIIIITIIIIIVTIIINLSIMIIIIIINLIITFFILNFPLSGELRVTTLRVVCLPPAQRPSDRAGYVESDPTTRCQHGFRSPDFCFQSPTLYRLSYLGPHHHYHNYCIDNNYYN